MTPRHDPKQLADVTYYMEASAADGKDVSVCKQLLQALTGISGPDVQAVASDQAPVTVEAVQDAGS